MLPCGGKLARGHVNKRKRDHDDNVIGNANANPILDTREYEVEFDDGGVSHLTANAFAQSMYNMCDNEGNRTLNFDAIIDHQRCSTALTYADQKFVDSHGKEQF